MAGQRDGGASGRLAALRPPLIGGGHSFKTRTQMRRGNEMCCVLKLFDIVRTKQCSASPAGRFSAPAGGIVCSTSRDCDPHFGGTKPTRKSAAIPTKLNLPEAAPAVCGADETRYR